LSTGCQAADVIRRRRAIPRPAEATLAHVGPISPAGSVVDIGLLLPDLLGTYGDSGNAIVLAQRLRWRGIVARVLNCTADRSPPTTCDVYLLGGGEDIAQQSAASWLREHPKLLAALGRSPITVAVCAGLQLLGTSMTDRAGRTHHGAGLLDLSTTPMRRRAVGDIVADCTIPGVGKLRGFENHRGSTQLGPDLTPLGMLRAGVGNSPRGRDEGVSTTRVVGTYLHGPVLARNPALADHILARALGGPLPELDPNVVERCVASGPRRCGAP
jgi:hypothetical protein